MPEVPLCQVSTTQCAAGRPPSQNSNKPVTKRLWRNR